MKSASTVKPSNKLHAHDLSPKTAAPVLSELLQLVNWKQI
jgi:hypothetical protein